VISEEAIGYERYNIGRHRSSGKNVNEYYSGNLEISSTNEK